MLVPGSVAGAKFSHSFRGYDSQEVSDFLRAVAIEIEEINDLVAEQGAQLERYATSDGHIDAVSGRQIDERVAHMLREAEDSAAALVAKAQQERANLLEAAEVNAAEIRNDADRELEGARQQARAMIEQTRVSREEARTSLNHKRRAARSELAQLKAGIDGLSEAHAEIRELIGVTAETIEGSLPSARAAAVAAVAQQELPDPPSEPEKLIDLRARRHRTEAVQEIDRAEVEADTEAAQISSFDSVDDMLDPVLEPDGAIEARRKQQRRSALGHIDSPMLRARGASESFVLPGGGDEIAVLAARIRGVRVVDTLRGPPALNSVESLQVQRDVAVETLGVDAGLALKRTLSDQINEALDALRRNESTITDISDLFPAGGDLVYGECVRGQLLEVSIGSSGGCEVDVDSIVDEVSEEVGGALRVRVEDFLDEPERIEARLRAVFREWRRERVEQVGQDAVARAYGLGLLEAMGEGCSVLWIQSPQGCDGPECQENGLAEAVKAGQAFPSGDIVAPARPGCRCLVVAADG